MKAVGGVEDAAIAAAAAASDIFASSRSRWYAVK